MTENKEKVSDKGAVPAKKRASPRKKTLPKAEKEQSVAPSPSFRSDMDEIRKILHEISDAVKTPAAETAAVENIKLMKILEGLSVMREDFIRLSRDMKKNAERLSAAEIIDSFGAYSIDIENLLMDAGVAITNTDGDILNTKYQKIVGVIPDEDPSRDGKVAERFSECYTYGNRVLWKERVAVYKKSQNQNRK